MNEEEPQREAFSLRSSSSVHAFGAPENEAGVWIEVGTSQVASDDGIDRRHPVDILADEYSARFRAGEAPSIEEYEQRAPEHQATIRSLFPTIAMIERMTDQAYADRKPRRKKLEEQRVIGDFRIIREIGRGGMGVVYEAIQQSLERRVALKVLSSGISKSSKQLQRFRREAESAARLHHTNIVPVYGIGEEDDVHFYAMQYIDGVPLAEAIETVRQRSSHDDTSHEQNEPSLAHQTRLEEDSSVLVTGSLPNVPASDATVMMQARSQSSDFVGGSADQVDVPKSKVQLDVESLPKSPDRPTTAHSRRKATGPVGTEPVEAFTGFFERGGTPEYFCRVAGLAAEVADALDYAHHHGVLHRDIKPSNLMLDRSGAVWIMDFGLVKILEREDLTQFGEIVGTVRYMAPEQLEGRANVTTDVYGLGLTLFELLTLKPAFDGDDAVTLAQRLHHSDIPRPRAVNPAIPRDLETIVLKATARDPAARYQSAKEFAEDLRRFCEDRPILARRVSPLERFWRWSRRNPALAAALCSIMVLLGAVAVVATVGKLNTESALLEAKSSQRRAETNLDSAINAFDSILENVTSRGLPRSLAFDIPQSQVGLTQTPLSVADALLLDRLLEFYRTFAHQNADNRALRSRIADAHQRAGQILVRLGRLNEAEADLRTAVALLERILESDPHNVDLVVRSAAIDNEIGELLLRRGEFRQTFNSHLEARAILLEQPASVQVQPAVRYELARATDLFASIDIRSGTNEGPGRPPGRRLDRDANVSHERASLNDHDNVERPRDPPPHDEQVSDRIRKARPAALDADRVNPMGGLSMVLKEASDQFQSLVKEFPGNAEYQFALAQCLRHRLVHAASNDDSKTARETFVEAVQILDRLTSTFPSEPKYRFELADTLTQASRAETVDEAAESLDRAVEIAGGLATRFPAASEYQLLLGTALARQAVNQTTGGSLRKAEDSLARSIEILDILARQFPDQGVIQIPLAKSCQQLGDLLRNTADDGETASTQLQRSRTILQTAIERFEQYLNSTQSNASNQRRGHFNTITLSRLYTSLADTLTKLDLSEDAQQAFTKARQFGKPNRRPR